MTDDDDRRHALTETATTTLDPAEVQEVMGRLVADMAATAGLQMNARTPTWPRT